MESKIKIYDDISDSEVLSRIEEKNSDALDYLFAKYSPMIHKEVDNIYKKNKNKGIDYNDLLQEGMLGFSEAISKFDDYSDVKFITFATLCVKRKLQKYSLKHNTIKNKMHLAELPLDSEKEGFNQKLKETIKDASGKEPLNKIINNESLNEILDIYLNNLSSSEREALLYDLGGMDVNDIAETMDITPKQVYNLIYRARKKIKKVEK